MHRRFITLFIAALLPAASFGTETLISENDKPPLKLLKQKSGEQRKKIVRVKKNGERKVLVKVKRVFKEPKTLFPLTDDPAMITDTYYPPEVALDTSEDINTTQPLSEPADENLSISASQPPVTTEDTNTSALPPPEPEHVPEAEKASIVSDEPTPAEEPADMKSEDTLQEDSPLPATNWKRHYLSLAAGSAARTRTTKVDTVSLGSYIALKNTSHTFLADGSTYEYKDSDAYAHIEAGYLYKPGPVGSSYYLGGYYDDDLIAVRAAYKYTFSDMLMVYPSIKLGGELAYDNGDNSDYDATAFFGAVSLEKRLFNGLIIGIEYLYLQRQWIKQEEFFGSVECEDRESALRLTLDVPLF